MGGQAEAPERGGARGEEVERTRAFPPAPPARLSRKETVAESVRDGRFGAVLAEEAEEVAPLVEAAAHQLAVA